MGSASHSGIRRSATRNSSRENVKHNHSAVLEENQEKHVRAEMSGPMPVWD